MKARTVGALGILTLALSACDSDLPPYHRLDRLRILAIAADPPWAGPGDTVEISALVSAPGPAPVELRWRWCPVDVGAASKEACPEPLSAPWPASDLGAEMQALLTLPGRAHIEARCTAVPDGCPDGQLVVFVQLEAMTPNDRLVGVREVVVDLEGRSHANPEIEDVEAREGTRAPVPLDSQAITTVPSGELELALWPSPESAEPADGGTEPLTVSWFVDVGELEVNRSRPATLQDPATNLWSLDPPGPEGPAATLRTVIRDHRGGTAWASFRVEVAP